MKNIATVSTTTNNNIDDFDRYSFGFQEGDNFYESFRNCEVRFHIDDINTAIHNILGSKLGVGEYFIDNYGTIYATGEYLKIAKFLKIEKERVGKFRGMPIPEDIVLDSLKNIQNICPTMHHEELYIRGERMLTGYHIEDELEKTDAKAKDGTGYYRLPTPIELCLGKRGVGGKIIGPGKSGQIVLSTRKGTNDITGVCMSYVTKDYDEAYENEFIAHYPHARNSIHRALIKRYGKIDNGIMIAPVIGMLPKYASIRSMMRLMRDWAKNLIDEELAELPGMAEMDLSNNFFELCSKQMDITPLPLLSETGDPITAMNNRLDYLSSVVTFRTINVLKRGVSSISSILPKEGFNLKANHHA